MGELSKFIVDVANENPEAEEKPRGPLARFIVNEGNQFPLNDTPPALKEVQDKNPQTEAENLALSEELNLPYKSVSADPQGVRQNKAKQEDIDALNTSTTLASWLRERTENAAVSKDDLIPLSQLMTVIKDNFRTGRQQVRAGRSQVDAFEHGGDSDQQKAADAEYKRLEIMERNSSVKQFAASVFAEASKMVGQQIEGLLSPSSGRFVTPTFSLGDGEIALPAFPLGKGNDPAVAILNSPMIGNTNFRDNLLTRPFTVTFEVEGADFMRTMVEAGMEREAAINAAYVVGGINAGLEVGALAVVLKPFALAGKNLLRKHLKDVMLRPENVKLLNQFTREYGAAIVAETSTEILQELVSVLGQNAIALTDDNIDSVSLDEAMARVEEVTVATLKGMALLAAPGPTLHAVSSARSEQRAKKALEKLDAIHKAAEDTQLNTRSRQKLGELIGREMVNMGVTEYFIDAETLINLSNDIGNPGLPLQLGITTDIYEQAAAGNDVSISAEKMGEVVFGAPLYDLLKGHLRENSMDISTEESKEIGQDADQVILENAEADSFIEDQADDIATRAAEEIEKDATARLSNADAAVKQAARDPQTFEKERKQAFQLVAETQRGAPEIQMSRVQRVAPGVISIVEPIGDLTFRLTDKFDFLGGTREEIINKSERALRILTQGFGFEKELQQNIRAQAKALDIDPKRVEANLFTELAKYAEEHKKVPVFNKLQLEARSAAIAVGEKRWADAAKHLEFVNKIANDKEQFTKMAGEFDPLIDERETSQDFIEDDTGEVLRPAEPVLSAKEQLEATAKHSDDITEVIAPKDLTLSMKEAGPSAFAILMDGKTGRVDGHQESLKETQIQISAFSFDRNGIAAQVAVTVPKGGITRKASIALARAVGRRPNVVYQDTEGTRFFNNASIPLVETRAEAEAEIAANEAQFKAEGDAIDAAVLETGSVGMFRTAQEIGMSAQQFAKYKSLIIKNKSEAVRDFKIKILKQQEREATKEWKQELQKVEEETREHLGRQQVYQAFNNVQATQLNREQTEAALAEFGVTLEELPTQKRKRRLYAPKNAKVSKDVELHAQENGYETAFEMFEDILTSKPFEQAIKDSAHEIMMERHGNIHERITRAREARFSLMKQDWGNVYLTELNLLRKQRGLAAANRRVFMAIARNQTRNTKFKDAVPTRFFNRVGKIARQAGTAFRKGDFNLASRRKTQQLLQFEIGKRLVNGRKRAEKQIAVIQKMANPKKKAAKNIPQEYRAAIKRLANRYGLSDLETNAPIPPWVRVPDSIIGEPKSIQDATLQEIEDLHNTIQAINQAGRKRVQLFKQLKGKLRQDEVNAIKEQVLNMKPQNRADTEATFDKARRGIRAALGGILNIDSILRHIDGFVENGIAHRAIKGRHDLGLNQGYFEGQEGFTLRDRRQSQELADIYNILPKKIRDNLHLKIRGNGYVRTRQEIYSAILNFGNEEGRIALENGNDIAEADVMAMVNDLTKEEVEFLNAIWKYLDGFWKEVETRQLDRENVAPDKVEAIPIDTPHGRLTGGYYPLRYNKRLTVAEALHDSSQGALQKVLARGGFAMSHTRRGHTLDRMENPTEAVWLNMQTLNTHIKQVAWDLEMGDALRDAWNVWNDKELRAVMRAQGFDHYWESTQQWLEDVIVGEIVGTDLLNSTARWIRSGFVISKLGFNVKTALLQPLGLSSTAAQLGKWNTFKALRHSVDPRSWKEVNKLSAFMLARDEAYNADIEVARELLSRGPIRHMLGPEKAAALHNMSFLMLRKAQRIVDVTTWMAAYDKGMNDFNNDQRAAIEFADLMVSRSQGSAVFGQRTAVERGRIGRTSVQSELVRMATPFLNYFITKNNVLWEKTKKTNFKNPWELFNFVTDVALLYFVEGAFLTLLAGVEDEEDLSDEAAFAKKTVQEGLLSFVAGFPFLRETVNGARGYSSGVLNSINNDFKNIVSTANTAMEEGEYTPYSSGMRSAVNIAATFSKTPGAAQVGKAMRAAELEADGERVEWWEYILGARDR